LKSPGHTDHPEGACVAIREVLDRVGDKWSVLVVERLGSESYVYIKTDGEQAVVARRGPSPGNVPGEAIELGLLAGRCHLFGPDGLALDRPGPSFKREPETIAP